MSLTTLIVFALQLSTGLSVVALGLKVTTSDAAFLFRRPDKLLNAMAAMYIAMPALAVAVGLLLDLPPASRIALVALSISPVPPVLPKRALKAGGRESYAIGLLVAGSLLAIVLIPLAMELFQVLFSVPLQMTARSVASLLLSSVIAPLAAGMLLRALAPMLAERIAGPTATLGTVLLVAGLIALLIVHGQQLVSTFGPSTWAALGAFSALGLLIGHLLGGPRFNDRTVLALYTSARHPGMALAIAQANFPQERTVVIAILLALLVGGIVSLPYAMWIKRQLRPFTQREQLTIPEERRSRHV